MSDDEAQGREALSTEDLDTLERILLDTARHAGVPERRTQPSAAQAPSGDAPRSAAEGDEVAASDTSTTSVAKVEAVASLSDPSITVAGGMVSLPAGLDDDDAEPLSLRDLERVFEPGEAPPSIADARPRSEPPPPPRRPSAPPPPPVPADDDDPPIPLRNSVLPPLPPPKHASAPPPPPSAEAEVLSIPSSRPEPDVEPGPDSARRDLAALASIRPREKGPDLEFDELMRIHVAPLGDVKLGPPAVPGDLSASNPPPSGTTGASLRPRPRPPLKSRAPVDDDASAVSDEARQIATAAAPIDPDLVPPSFRELEAPPSKAGEAPRKKKKKKKKSTSLATPDASLAPTAASVEPKPRAPEPSREVAPPAAAEPRSRAPLYVLAAAALLGGGYLLGKVGDEPKPEVSSAPTTQVPPRPAETVAPRTEAPAVVQAAPTATPTEPAPTASSGSSAEPAATATEAPTGTGTATSTGPLPTGAATAAESPTAATAAAPTATASSTGAPPASAVPAETASAAPDTPPPSEAPPFDKAAASAALSSAAGAASGCKQEGDPSGSARVQVTFVPSGRVTSANVQGPPFAGTATGGCIARAFRSASVPPFSGDPVTVSKTVTIP